MSDPDKTIEMLEVFHKLRDAAELACKAADMYESVPDETPVSAGEIKASLKSLSNIIRMQQTLINKQVERALHVHDQLEDLVNKHTKK